MNIAGLKVANLEAVEIAESAVAADVNPTTTLSL